MARSFSIKHWPSWLAACALLPSLWSGIKWLLDWAERLDFIASHISGIEGSGAVFGALTNPPPWAIFPTAIIGGALIWYDVKHPNWWRKVGATANKYRVTLIICIAAFCFLAGGVLAVTAYRQYRYPPPPPPPEESALLKRAQSDFRISGGIGQANESIDLQDIGVFPVSVRIWFYSDLISMGRFLVLYVPETMDMQASPEIHGFKPVRSTYETINKMSDRYPDIIKRIDASGSAGLGDLGAENWRYSTQAVFTGAIYVYYEGNLTEAEKVTLRQIYKDKGAMVFLRDRRYMVESTAPNNR
ncbi:MAG: hypothetical protein E7774_08820 [Bradyrhizobium sp.]|nr:MAG: hypothetical protein E7774_08820 [Bradyrhizobium sp.]